MITVAKRHEKNYNKIIMVAPKAPSPIKNDAGQVAMRHQRQQGLTLNCHNSGEQHTYIFAIRANIPLAWVNEVDVPCAIAHRGGCCGARKPGVVTYANENDVRQWTNGGGQ